MVRGARHADLAFPFWIQQIVPALRRVLGRHELLVVGRQHELVCEAHRAVVEHDRFGIDADALVVERLVQLSEPQRRVLRVGDDHQVPLRRRAARG